MVATSAVSASHTLPAPCFVIEASGVNHAYEGQDGWVRALEGFEIAIPRNEFLCLLGPSGCGKSSFLRIVTGLDEAARRSGEAQRQPDRGPGPRSRHRVSGAGAVSLAHRAAQCRLRTRNERHEKRGGERARSSRPAHRRSRAGHEFLSVPTLRRHATSGGGCARLGIARCIGAAHGRAVFGDRCASIEWRFRNTWSTRGSKSRAP